MTSQSVLGSFLQQRALRIARLLLLFLTALACIAATMYAQQNAAAPVSAGIVDPPPERVRMSAQRTTEAMRIDGQLDESAWNSAPAVRNFMQIEPKQGVPSSYQTSVRVLYDDTNLYFGFFVADSLGRDGIRVRSLQRKFADGSNDYVGVTLDALHDGRTVVDFRITPYGNQSELQVFDDGARTNSDWEAVWKTRTVISDSGWTAEISIPWATLRYKLDGQPWGVNFYRSARRTNETSGWQPWPRAFSQHRMAFGGLLENLEPPPPRRNVRLRPYVVSQTRRSAPDNFASPRTSLGGEGTWAITPNTVFDATVNTDFAQADVDRQVVNLSRFSVFFPERRQFFLENASVFETGSPSGFEIEPFFSRRIGLSDAGSPVAIKGGGRVVHRDAGGSLAAMVVHQGGDANDPSATFGVGRFSRNVGKVGNIGLLAVGRHDSPNGVTASRNSGVAALDGFTRFGTSASLNGMVSMTSADSAGHRGYAGHYYLQRTTSSLYAGLVGGATSKSYNPTTGFVSGTDLLFTSPALIGDWRPGWRPRFIRNFKPALVANVTHVASTLGLQQSFLETYVDVIFQNGALLYPDVQRHGQHLASSFSPVRGVVIRAGNYTYTRGVFFASSNSGAPVSATIVASTGGFYDRSLDAVSTTIRSSPNAHFTGAIAHTYNRFHGNGSEAHNHLLIPEMRIAFNPRVQATAFYQLNSDAQRGVLNARFSWEFSPLSYFFLVWNERRDIGDLARSPATTPTAQQLVAKFTWLRQF